MMLTTELTYLAATAALTGLIWIPYIVNTAMVRGAGNAVGYPENPKPLAGWAQRLKLAHYNAVENLVVFAALVLVAHVSASGNDTTAAACIVYFWARVAHLVVYTAKIPLARTIAFTIGWICQVVIAVQILF